MAQTTFGRRNLPKLPRLSNRSVDSTSLADDLALGIPGPGCRWLMPAVFGLVLPVAALTAVLATFGSVPAAKEAAVSLVAAAGTTKPAGCKVSLGDFEKLGKGLTVADADEKMGCAGIVITQTNLAGIPSIAYSWAIGGDLPGKMFATFDGGRLVDKSYLTMRRP